MRVVIERQESGDDYTATVEYEGRQWTARHWKPSAAWRIARKRMRREVRHADKFHTGNAS